MLTHDVEDHVPDIAEETEYALATHLPKCDDGTLMARTLISFTS